MKEDLFGNKVKERGTLDENCKTCGHTTRLYRHTFDFKTAIALEWFASANKVDVDWSLLPDNFGGVNKVNLQSQTTILGYLGLLEKAMGPDGKQIPKMWRLTDTGYAVAKEGGKIPQWVWVYQHIAYPKGDNPPLVTLKEARLINSHNPVSDYEIADEKVFLWYWERLKNGPVKQSCIGEISSEQND